MPGGVAPRVSGTSAVPQVLSPLLAAPPVPLPVQLRGGPETRALPIVLTSLPVTVNMFLYQGDDFDFTLIVLDPEGEPYDLEEVGATCDSHIRERPHADLAGEFVTAMEANEIYMHLTHAVSSVIPLRSVWDVQIVVDGRVTTLAAGQITLTEEVTL